jgi:hypothetical protein
MRSSVLVNCHGLEESYSKVEGDAWRMTYSLRPKDWSNESTGVREDMSAGQTSKVLVEQVLSYYELEYPSG